MLRIFKGVGLALMAVLAIGVFSAGAASAAEFEAAGEGTLGGSGGAGETFSTEAGDIICSKSTFSGTVKSGKQESATIHPTYSGCKAFGFPSATVNTEKCNYVFKPSVEVEAGVFDGKVDVSCGTGESIKITSATCSAEVKSQTGLANVETTNKTVSGKMDIDVHLSITGIAYTVTNDGFFCPFSGIGEKSGAKYDTTSPLTMSLAVFDFTVVK